MPERLALPSTDWMAGRRFGALAASALAHAAALAAVLVLLQRVVLPAAPLETTVSMVFAPAPAAVPPAEPDAATPQPPEPLPPIAEPELPLPEPPPPVALPAPIPEPAPSQVAQPEPKAEPAPPPARPARRPEPSRATTTHPLAQSVPAPTSPSAVPAAAAIAPLLPAHPVAGMETGRPPPYPESARRRGQQGRVVVQVNVSVEGLPLSVSIAQSSGVMVLDDAALAWVRQWHFVPASRGGTPVPGTAEIPVRYRLTD